MSSDPKQELADTYGLEQATLATVREDEAEEILDTVARAEHLAGGAGSSDLHEQAVSDTGEKLAELSATHGVDPAALVPDLDEDTALQAALADAEEARESGQSGDETTELSDAEQEEKQRLETQLADLRDKDTPLAEEEAERIENEIADLTED